MSLNSRDSEEEGQVAEETSPEERPVVKDMLCEVFEVVKKYKEAQDNIKQSQDEINERHKEIIETYSLVKEMFTEINEIKQVLVTEREEINQVMAELMTVVREIAPKMEKRAEEFKQERESYQASVSALLRIHFLFDAYRLLVLLPLQRMKPLQPHLFDALLLLLSAISSRLLPYLYP
jgi:septal ring factor EnvC (AmiA/AmiB activator)